MAKKTIKDRNNKAIAPATRSDMVFRRDRKSIDEVMLVKEPQELTPEQRNQVQTNIGVKSTVDVIGAGDVSEIPLEIAQDNMFQSIYGTAQSQSGYFISKPYPIKIGDVIKGTFQGGASTSRISKSTADGVYISTEVGGATATDKSLNWVSNFDGYVIFSGQRSTLNLKLIPCDLAGLLVPPAGGYNKYLCEAGGATWDDTKSKWLLNELELTESEMDDVLAAAIKPSIFVNNKGFYAYNSKIKTNLPFTQNTGYCTADISNFYQNCSNIEVVNTGGKDAAVSVTGMSLTYRNCPKLRKELSIIDVSQVTFFNKPIDMSPNVESIRLRFLKVNLDYSPSAKINYGCLKYIVDNAKNTEAITITVHPTTYSYLTGTAEPTAEVGGTTEEWQALVTTASEKQISFATA